SAVTELGSSNNSSSMWSWISSGTNNLSYKIHYYIKCPKTLNANLTNKYGNINLPDWQGNAVINVSYGKLTTQDISAKTKAFVSYGGLNMKNIADLYTLVKYSDGKIQNANQLEMQVSYSDIDILSVGKLSATNKYSDITVESISNSANLTGNYNDYKIGDATIVDIKGNYTNVAVDNLLTQFKSEQSYGATSIKNVGPNAKAINFDGRYTGLTIRGLKNYKLNFSGKYSTPTLTSGFIYRVKNKDGNSFSCEGEDGNGQVDVRIATSYGGVKIQ
nr:hypothetical protein [Saprospiraceae bacterium]